MGKESRVLELGHNRLAWRKALEMLSLLSVGKHLRPLVRGEAPSASRPSAQIFSSESQAFIVEDPIVDILRAASQSEAFAVPKSGSLIDEALRDEASRYVGLTSPSVGGRETSSSSFFSGIDQAGTNEGVSSSFDF